MNLWEAPFHVPLRILSLEALPKEAQQVLTQLGLDLDEEVEKIQVAPLGDPISLKIGEQIFTLRENVCQNIQVRPEHHE